MIAKQSIGAVLVALLVAVSGGVLASVATQQPAQQQPATQAADGVSTELVIDGRVAANETVSITTTVAGEPLANAQVEVNGQFVGMTDTNGTLANVSVPDADEFEVEVETEDTKLKLELEDAALERAAASDSTSASIVIDGTPDSGATVTTTLTTTEMMTVTESPLSGADVELNKEKVGATNASGQVMIQVPTADEFEFEAETGDVQVELELEGAALQQLRSELAPDEEDAPDEEEAVSEDALPTFTVQVVGDPASDDPIRVVVSENGEELLNETIGPNEKFESEFVADGTEVEVEIEREAGDFEVKFEAKHED